MSCLCDETGYGVRIVGCSEETVVVHLQSNCQTVRRDANGGGYWEVEVVMMVVVDSGQW